MREGGARALAAHRFLDGTVRLFHARGGGVIPGLAVAPAVVGHQRFELPLELRPPCAWPWYGMGQACWGANFSRQVRNCWFRQDGMQHAEVVRSATGGCAFCCHHTTKKAHAC